MKRIERFEKLIIDNEELATVLFKALNEPVILFKETEKTPEQLLKLNKEMANELMITHQELAYQIEENELLVAESLIINEKNNNQIKEIIVTNKKISILSEYLLTTYQNIENLTGELFIADAEIANRAAELIIANKEKAKRTAKLIVANKEKAKRAAELIIANKVNTRRISELIKTNQKNAKNAKELIFANKELSNQIAINKIKEDSLSFRNRISDIFLTVSDIDMFNEVLKVVLEAMKSPIGLFGYSDEFGALVIPTLTKGIWGERKVPNQTFNTWETWGNSTLTQAMRSKKTIYSNLPSTNIPEGHTKIQRHISQPIIFHGESIGLLQVANKATDYTDPDLQILDRFSKQIAPVLDSFLKRKKSEDLMLESEEKYSTAFNSSPDIMIIMNVEDGKIIETNDAFTSVSGFTKEEAIAFGDLILWKDNEERDWVLSTIHEGRNIAGKDLSFKKKNGDLLIGLLSTKIININKKAHIITSIHDITERKYTELELIKAKVKAEENEEKFRNLFENSPIGKSMTGIDGSLHVNKSFSKIVGYSEEELREKNMTDITHPEDLLLTDEKLQSLINREAEEVFFEKRYIHKNGNIVWVEVSTYLQMDKKNEPQFFITTIIDITAQKNYENELIAAKEKAEESDRLKSAFLTNMSHEIRTPMNGILGFTELLKEPSLTIDEQQDYIQTIQISGERMLNTINSIVDISKIESGLIGVEINETNLNEKIKFTYKFFNPDVENKGLKLFFKNGLPTNEANIKTDNEKVYGILTNLIRNAIKFTSKGSIEFGYEKKGEYLEFFVKDSGVGIPQNQHELIFERFRQGSESNNRGYEGSGLGLSISKSYVEMLGGRIWLESEEGIGSTFYFTIPYIAASEEKTTIGNVIIEVQLKNMKILIVEDDEISYSMLTKTIQNISKEVLHAITGDEAVEACRNNPDLDLVLMDIRMPKMNGLEATQQIRQFNKDVIIIAQTAYTFAGDSEKALEAGCNDYISKPINKTLLYELINKHCNK